MEVENRDKIDAIDMALCEIDGTSQTLDSLQRARKLYELLADNWNSKLLHTEEEMINARSDAYEEGRSDGYDIGYINGLEDGVRKEKAASKKKDTEKIEELPGQLHLQDQLNGAVYER